MSAVFFLHQPSGLLCSACPQAGPAALWGTPQSEFLTLEALMCQDWSGLFLVQSVHPGGWWQGSLSGPPLCLHPQPQGVTLLPGMCAKRLCGPWGTRWTRWPVKAASGETSPGSWDLASRFPPFLSDPSWEQRWGWRVGRDGETEDRQRLFSAHSLAVC